MTASSDKFKILIFYLFLFIFNEESLITEVIFMICNLLITFFILFAWKPVSHAFLHVFVTDWRTD